jgi:tetratricopeptide (TPR) repeat protein
VVQTASSLPPARPSGFLRPEPSRFVGRGAELDRLDAPLESARLVTIVGPGGIGKTRLALRYAATRQAHFGGLWFCDMRDASTPDEMAYVALRALGHGRAPSPIDAEAALIRALVARPQALVILDNLEHLLPKGAVVVREWLAAMRASGADARFVVTSREPLGIPGEQVVPLGGVTDGDAVDLFVERVRARMSFQPGDSELASIAEIVRQLSGVPLAIELAAGRVGVDGAAALLERITPSGGFPGLFAAESALARGFALLQPEERHTLARCSVFRGAFSLQAAVAIAGEDANATIATQAAEQATVIALAAKNLLRVERYQPMRFSMCEGIRSLAAESLLPSDAARVRLNHARFFCGRASEIVDCDVASEPVDAADDWEDLHAAMAFGAKDNPELVLRIALAIDVLALGSGLGAVQLAHLDDALRRGAACDLGLLGRALLVRSGALYALGRLVEARRDAETALSLARELGDTRRAGAAYRAAAQAAFQLGELEAAREHLTSALTLERSRGEPSAIAAVHIQTGSLHNSLGELDLARTAFERSLKLARGSGDAACEALAVMGLAWTHFESGERDAARDHYAYALGIVRHMKMARSERIVLGYLGLLYFNLGDLELAEDHLHRAALASRRAGDLRVEGIFEGVRGGVLATLDRIDAARAAFDLADELLARNAFYQRAIGIHRGHLDLAEARAAAAAGHVRTAEAHVAEARWRIEAAHAFARRSDDARMAITILERALADF